MAEKQAAAKGPDWDTRYRAGGGALFGTAPNEYLRMSLARGRFRPATALCLADGDGRNGRWLAKRGLAVTAVDISKVATEQAHASDTKSGNAVERIVADLRDWQPEPGQTWDLVCLIYLQGPPALRRKAVETGLKALAPGGLLVLEGFAGTPDADAPLGPDDADKRFQPGDVPPLPADVTLLEETRGLVRLDEGERHAGMARVLRLTALRAA